MSLPIAYVAGPYSPRSYPWPFSYLEIIRNVYHAIKAGTILLSKGWGIIVPHSMMCWAPCISSLYGLGLHNGCYLEVGLQLLEKCDAIVVLGDSPGVRQEVKRAKELGKPIFYGVELVPSAEEFTKEN